MGSSSSAPAPVMDMPPPVPMNAQTMKFDSSGTLQPDDHKPFQQADFSSFITALLAKSANKPGPSWGGDTSMQQAAAFGQDPYQKGSTPPWRTDPVSYFSHGIEDPQKVAELLMRSGANEQQQKDAIGMPTSHPLKATA